jgi:filamentous hemagglutinin family protein
LKCSIARSTCLVLSCFLAQFSQTAPIQAQSIVPATGSTGTIVTPNGNRLDISGGQFSSDGTNLFHSFTQLGLTQDQVANFISNPQIQNILGRITGGNVSVIDGLLQVSGGNSNLFLVNPAGIIFGTHASLNLSGSFTATTANGIQFGSNWFNASGANDYSSLVGNPSTFAFTMPQPGSILNAGSLAVVSGQTLTLVGGTVISTGQLTAPQGRILVSAVPGGNWVRINPPGQTIGLEIHPPVASITQPNTWLLPIVALPELLTGKGGTDFKSIVVNANGQASLANSNIPVETGDVIATQVLAQSATLSASHNLTLVESQLNTTGNLSLLAGDTVRVRDSTTHPFVAHVQGNLYIQGNQGIDILALNHPGTPFQSGGNLTLVSAGIVSGDSHFASGGQFSILNLAGQPGTFVSLYDPIISTTGDVTFGDYTGVALKVETLGSINAGNITITGPDTSLSGSDPDIATLTSSRALILRAGLTSLSNPANMPQTQQGTTFTSSGSASSPGSIITKAIKTLAGPTENVNGGTVVLSAPGGIRADLIDSSSSLRNGGTISLSSNSGTINVGSLDSSSQRGNGGTISVSNNSGSFVSGSIDSSSQTGNGGTIVIASNSGSINTGSVDSSSQTGNGGTVSINSNSGRTSTGSVDSSSQTGNGGTVAIGSNSGSINTGSVDSSSQTGNGGTVAISSNSGSINTGSVDVSSQTGNSGIATFRSSSGTVTTGSNSTNASVISTNTQNSTSTTQPTKTLTGVPSDIPYSNLPEASRNPELTAESIERQRGKEFEDVLAKSFSEKFTDARDIRFALHALENQFLIERIRLAKPDSKVSQSEINKRVPRKPAVIYAVINKSNKLQLVVQTADREYYLATNATREELKKQVDVLREAVDKPTSGEQNNAYKEPSQKLYDWLLKPLTEKLKLPLCLKLKPQDSDCIGTLLFSPDAELRLVPLAALQDWEDQAGKNLMEKFDVNISLIPSLNYTDITYSSITEYQILSMGSNFSSDSDNGLLASVPIELKSIQRVWRTQVEKKNIILNNEFTPEALERSRNRPFRIIHIATHAGFRNQGEKDNKFEIQFQDKSLTLASILKSSSPGKEENLNLRWKDFRVDLLVLSACETLGGLNEDQGKIFVGLPGQVGVKSTLASLWEVNDPGALVLMTLFYKNLSTGMTKAEALKQAQLSLKHGVIDSELTALENLVKKELQLNRENDLISQRLLLIAGFLREKDKLREELKNPYYWATFTLVGNPW